MAILCTFSSLLLLSMSSFHTSLSAVDVTGSTSEGALDGLGFLHEAVRSK